MSSERSEGLPSIHRGRPCRWGRCNGHEVAAWFGCRVEMQISKRLPHIQSAKGWSRVSRGVRKPLGHGVAGRMKSPCVMGSKGAGTLPCRAGGGWGPGGRHALWSMGFGESEVFPMVLIRLNAGEAPMAWGMQRGRAAAPLPRLRGTTTHILRSALSGAWDENEGYGRSV